MAVSLRASDADRERIAEQLRRTWCDGYLSFETFSERVESAYRARSQQQLLQLVRDLPLGPLGVLRARWERVRATLPFASSHDVALDRQTHEFALPDQPDVPLTLGRAADCTHRLTDETVSRHHAAVRWEDDVWVIYDLESTNGVYVNGRRVWRAALRRGDHIALGAASLLVAATPFEGSSGR